MSDHPFKQGVPVITDHQELILNHLIPGSDKLACSHCGELYLAVPLVELFNRIRTAVGTGLTVTSGYRCKRYQQQLKDRGYKAASPATAPHCYGVALDIAVPKGYTQEKFAKLIIKVAKGDARVGYKAYGDGSFVHIDVAHKLVPNPSPTNFVAGVVW